MNLSTAGAFFNYSYLVYSPNISKESYMLIVFHLYLVFLVDAPPHEVGQDRALSARFSIGCCISDLADYESKIYMCMYV